ncbi:MAG TPA: glycosyltransferase family 4 protein [bacterium]|nr:glycosyltransferase family 4 protein [bacterium]
MVKLAIEGGEPTKLLMFAAIGTPDGKPRLLRFPPGEAPEYDRSVSTHQAIRKCKYFPKGWQLDLVILTPFNLSTRRGLKKKLESLAMIARIGRLAFWACRKYDVLICGQVTMVSICLGLFQRLLFLHRPVLIVREFMLGAYKAGTPSWFRLALIKFIFKEVALIVCSSHTEAEHYCELLGWPSSRAVFLHLPSLRPHLRPKSTSEAPFILSAGRTGRDYGTLLQAVKGLELKVTLVCSPKNLEGLEIPDTVQVRYDISRTEYESLVESCTFLVIPLVKANCSAGQRVIEAAMSCGKAVIATNTAGTEDYIINGETGILVKPDDVGAMRSAVWSLWEDTELRERLGKLGREYALRHFSDEAYAEGFLNHLKKILSVKKA